MSYPTPYAEVNRFTDDLLARVQAQLGPQFLGFYFYGSLCYGDFTPGRSDLDFLVLTREGLDADLIAELESMHANLTAAGDPWALHSEGVYLTQKDLRRHNPDGPPRPTLGIGGKFYQAPLGADWIFQRHLLQQHGWPVVGPDIRPLIDPVSPDQRRAATLELLNGWWASRLDEAEWLRPPEYQAFTVLTLCRARHTLQTGELATKPEAATWALEHVEARWHPLIREAAAWWDGMEFDHLDQVRDCLQATLAWVRAFPG